MWTSTRGTCGDGKFIAQARELLETPTNLGDVRIHARAPTTALLPDPHSSRRRVIRRTKTTTHPGAKQSETHCTHDVALS